MLQLMTAAGMLRYQALVFSHSPCMILAPLKQRLQNHLADSHLTSPYFFYSLGEAELKCTKGSNHLQKKKKKKQGKCVAFNLLFIVIIHQGREKAANHSIM